MNIEKLPILTDCAAYRIVYPKRQKTFVPGRPFSSLSFRIRGTTRILGEGLDIVSTPGSLTFVPTGYSYRTESPDEGEMIALHFYSQQSCGQIPATATVTSHKTLLNLFESAERQFTARGCDMMLMATVYQILAEANGIFHPSANIPPRIRQSKHHADENLADPNLRIRDLAAICGTSETWFRREFEQYYGKSPLEYIKHKRIETAKLLLESGLYTVTEVAFRTGFESSSYFSAEFRRLEGISPREYKNRLK